MFEFFWDLFSYLTGGGADKQSEPGENNINAAEGASVVGESEGKRSTVPPCGMRRKALVIGINYKSLANKGVHLNGCVNDAQRMYSHVCTHMQRDLASQDDRNEADQTAGAAKEPHAVSWEVRVLCDEPVELSVAKDKRIKTRVLKSKPTRSAIERSLRWLASGADADTRLWLSYSGHGVNVVDKNGDERDGKDEALVPLDFEKRGMIVDDWLRKNLIDALPRGAQLFGLIDCCHSGTALDLPITFEDKSVRVVSKAAKRRKRAKDAQWRLVQQRTRYENVAEASADVVMLSGCRDNQTSADAWEDGASTGALSHAFLKFCEESATLELLLQSMSTWLAMRRYAQRPLLSFGSESTESSALRSAVKTI